MIRALALALTWLTVVPVTVSEPVDRALARRALFWAPVVGAGLGVIAALVLLAGRGVGAPALLSGLATVAALAALTRAMHLDGLADTADGLGSYGERQRALEVMRDPAAGPFAVVVLVLVLAAQAVALATLGASGEVGGLLAVVVAVSAGRAAICWCARTGVPAARQDGLGALVADSQPPALVALFLVVLVAVAVAVVPARPWQGPLAVCLAALAVVAFSAHTRRRFGGVTGDVLGAAGEVATTVVLVVCALG